VALFALSLLVLALSVQHPLRRSREARQNIAII
jgi:hypothetical protein